MKKRIAIAGIVSALFALPFAASAAQFKAEENPSLGTGETVQGNLYMGGGNVSSAGNVRGDLIVGGGNIIVSGPIQNDLLAGGGSITVTSDIGGDLRIGGGNITVQGKVAGDAIIGGGQVTIGGAGVGGDAAIGGGAITLTAPVTGNVKIGGGEVKIDAPVRGNVEIMAEKVTLGPRAVIEGNLTYSANEAATMQEGAVVRGETEFKQIEQPSNGISAAAIGAFFTLAPLAKLLMSFAGALAIYLIFPRYARELIADFTAKPLENLGRGFVTFIVMPVGSIILMLTIIGVPLGAIGLLGFIITMIFVSLIAPIVTGSVVHAWIWKPAEYQVNWWIIMMGVVIYFLLGFVPLVGWLAKFGIMLISLGAAVALKWRIAKEWR
jgi:hypothetical protein